MPGVTRSLITAKRLLSEDAFAIDLLSPEIAAEAKPGQFVMVRGADGVDPITPRPISIFALTAENGSPSGFTLLIKVIGAGTRAIDTKSVGDSLAITGPLGCPLSIVPEREYLCLLISKRGA